MLALQVECLGYVPLLVIAKADAMCASFKTDTLGCHDELDTIKQMVGACMQDIVIKNHLCSNDHLGAITGMQ